MSLETLLCPTSKETPLPSPIFETVLHFTGSGIAYAGSRANHFPEHSDSRLKIAVPLNGASIHVSWQTASGQQKRQHIKPGCVSIIPAHLPHDSLVEQAMEMIVIAYEPLWIEQLADELIGKPIEIVEQWTARDPLISQLGSELQTEFERGQPRRLYAESVTTVLATHLIRHYATQRLQVRETSDALSPQKLQQVVDYIHNRLEQNVELTELAQVAGMSQYRFARAFKQSTGLPPHQYLLSCRIERAKHLLRNTQLSIAQISYSLGFASQSHFTTTFRRLITTTPKAYRTAH